MPTPSSAAPPPPVDEQGRTGAGFTSPRQANTPVHSHVRVDQWHGIGLQRVRTGAIVVGHGQSVLHRPVSANPAAGRVLDIFVPVGARSTSRRRVSLPDNALQVGSLGPLERAQRVGGSRRACGESSPAWPGEASWRGTAAAAGAQAEPGDRPWYTRAARPGTFRPAQPRATVSGRAAGLAARPGALGRSYGRFEGWMPC
jgi:hypothetical protein